MGLLPVQHPKAAKIVFRAIIAVDKTVNNDLNAIQNKAGDAVTSLNIVKGDTFKAALNKKTTTDINNDVITDAGD